jgi:hypothetical protein
MHSSSSQSTGDSLVASARLAIGDYAKRLGTTRRPSQSSIRVDEGSVLVDPTTGDATLVLVPASGVGNFGLLVECLQARLAPYAVELSQELGANTAMQTMVVSIRAPRDRALADQGRRSDPDAAGGDRKSAPPETIPSRRSRCCTFLCCVAILIVIVAVAAGLFGAAALRTTLVHHGVLATDGAASLAVDQPLDPTS